MRRGVKKELWIEGANGSFCHSGSRQVWLFMLVISVVSVTALALPEPRQNAQIETGTQTGVVGVRIALPEFQPATNDEKALKLTAVFNTVLWDDLDYSGVLTLVSRSFYPIGKFSRPRRVPLFSPEHLFLGKNKC